MRIDNSSGVGGVQGVRGKSVRGIQDTASAADSVELSARAADIRTAMDALAGQPEVREQQVADLQRQIEDGSFDPNVEALAEKLLGG